MLLQSADDPGAWVCQVADISSQQQQMLLSEPLTGHIEARREAEGDNIRLRADILGTNTTHVGQLQAVAIPAPSHSCKPRMLDTCPSCHAQIQHTTTGVPCCSMPVLASHLPACLCPSMPHTYNCCVVFGEEVLNVAVNCKHDEATQCSSLPAASSWQTHQPGMGC